MLKLNVEKMKSLREKRNLTQGDAAARCNMTASRWNDIETRGRANITIETLGIIARGLGCRPADLLLEVK